MTEFELIEYRKKYTKLKNEQNMLKEAQDELKKLMETKEVRRYLELLDIVDLTFEEEKDEKLIDKSFSKQIQSNHIMIYMGSYVYNTVLNENNDYLTYDEDREVSYKAYMDLETMQAYNILLDDCEEFEEMNLTIYIPVKEYTSHEYTKNYFDIRNWFLKQLIVKEQDEVIEDLKKIKDDKYKTLFMASHTYKFRSIAKKMGMVDELDIEDFINNHSEGGFVEKFCLTEDEQRRVRTYRKNNQKK